jgi:hypothetical protein
METQAGDTIMSTKITIALAIILGVTSGALAQTKKQHSPNPSWDVYNSRGAYVGSDPDSRVRLELQRDTNMN